MIKHRLLPTTPASSKAAWPAPQANGPRRARVRLHLSKDERSYLYNLANQGGPPPPLSAARTRKACVRRRTSCSRNLQRRQPGGVPAPIPPRHILAMEPARYGRPSRTSRPFARDERNFLRMIFLDRGLPWPLCRLGTGRHRAKKPVGFVRAAAGRHRPNRAPREPDWRNCLLRTPTFGRGGQKRHHQLRSVRQREPNALSAWPDPPVFLVLAGSAPPRQPYQLFW